MTEYTKTWCVLHDADEEVSKAMERLREIIGVLADRLGGVAARIDREGVAAGVNELGEVQGLGFDVDRACALFEAAKRTRYQVGRAVDAAREER